ncbi:hypothetical protein BDR07DRAFT_1387741, partial [Suillus spraguei]
MDLRVTNPMDIVAACRGLVTYNEKTGTVALSRISDQSPTQDLQINFGHARMDMRTLDYVCVIRLC